MQAYLPTTTRPKQLWVYAVLPILRQPDPNSYVCSLTYPTTTTPKQLWVHAGLSTYDNQTQTVMSACTDAGLSTYDDQTQTVMSVCSLIYLWQPDPNSYECMQTYLPTTTRPKQLWVYADLSTWWQPDPNSYECMQTYLPMTTRPKQLWVYADLSTYGNQTQTVTSEYRRIDLL